MSLPTPTYYVHVHGVRISHVTSNYHSCRSIQWGGCFAPRSHNTFYLFIHFTSSSRALQSVVDFGFQYNFPPFLTVLSHCMLISYSHDLQILLNLIYPSFTWSSSFPCSFHFSCHIVLGILSLFILSICPHHLNLRDFINFTISASSNISSISLFVLILQLSPSFMGPEILLTIFLSNVLREFISSDVTVQASDP
jgi:hypothetical protein